MDETTAAGQEAVDSGLIVSDVSDRAERRAIVCFVDDNPHLVQQFLALRESWLYAQSDDTDVVAIGPPEVLRPLPHDVVKIAQEPAANDPVWRDYRYANAVACLNGAGADRLDGYRHLLWTHTDTFITPAWNMFYPTEFTVGSGGYANNDDVRRRIETLAAEFGLVHRGLTNIGATWYGPTEVIRRAAAFCEMLMKHLLTSDFADDEGAWPGWYRGVATKYAGEIAVNHCAPDAKRSNQLDGLSTSGQSTGRVAHIHCWHTDENFSKHHFMANRYTSDDTEDLDLGIVRDYCMEMSVRSVMGPVAERNVVGSA